MNTRVYVDNLAAATTENELRDLFSPYGNVAEVNVPVDRTNGRPHRFGIVTMATSEGARAAIQALNGKKIGARSLIVVHGHAAVLAREDGVARAKILIACADSSIGSLDSPAAPPANFTEPSIKVGS